MNISRTIFPTISLCAGLTLAALGQTSRSVWDGVYTAEQAKRGAALYSMECASCHGLALNGGEMAPALTGGEFLSNWSGLTVGDLFDRIRQSMPADRPGSLNREKNADILAHILSMNQFPAGTMELDQRVDFLKQIRIEATRPNETK
ncbi:MAG TPA: cytochrome c [Bryobacteraceae bacterium]|nr:cytochrome c [Bryobacteraceae bacterium]